MDYRIYDEKTGVVFDSSFGGAGICITEDSPLWEMADKERGAKIRMARERLPAFDEFLFAQYFIANSGIPSAAAQMIGVKELGLDKAALEKSLLNPLLSNEDQEFIAEALVLYENTKQARKTRRSPRTSLRGRVIERDGNYCRYCGDEVTESYHLHIDHVVPYCLGGLTEFDNLVVACRKCNGNKAGKTLKEAGMTLRELPT